MFRKRAWLIGLAVVGLTVTACAGSSSDLTGEAVPATSVSPATTVELVFVALDYEAAYQEAVGDIEDQELLTFLEAVKEYTIAFQDPAAAVAAGYVVDPNGCQATDGLHYLNRDLIGDGVTGEVAPEGILYGVSESGLQLVGVEYFVLSEAVEGRPQILGRITYGPGNVPNLGTIYWRHVWLYEKPTSGGLFAQWNGRVGC